MRRRGTGRPFALGLACLGLGCSYGARDADGRLDARAVATPEVGAPKVTPSPPKTKRFAFVGGTLVGVGPRDVTVEGPRIVAIGEASSAVEQVNVRGLYLAPAFIDAHVHLTYLPVGEALLSRGVAGAVDLAAPVGALAADVTPLILLQSGPMITAQQGYPTTSWGSGGYGLEVASPFEAASAVHQLFRAGAAVIKLPFTGEPTLSDLEARAAVARAHELGLKVVAHALGARDARRAADAGVDALAHTPTELLDEPTLAAFGERAVVSTLAAFGGAQATIDNLRNLATRGATVLYGTDLGNTQGAGIQSAELALLERAGLDGAAIVRAGTRSPAEYFGFSEHGEIAVGKRASILLLAEDPERTPQVLSAPVAVYIDGQVRK